MTNPPTTCKLCGDAVEAFNFPGNVCLGCNVKAHQPPPGHDCYDHAVPYVSDGPLGHGFDCGLCGKFLQAG